MPVTYYECADCGIRFSRKKNIIKHITVKHTDKEFQCAECKMQFKQKEQFSNHLSKCHSGAQMYKCHICDRVFRRESYLMQHIFSHSSAKPFQCQKCDKKFTKKSHLSYHMFSHANPKVYKCPKCNETFSSKHKFRKHLSTNIDDEQCQNTICILEKTEKHINNSQISIIPSIELKDADLDLWLKQECEKTSINKFLTKQMIVNMNINSCIVDESDNTSRNSFLPKNNVKNEQNNRTEEINKSQCKEITISTRIQSNTPSEKAINLTLMNFQVNEYEQWTKQFFEYFQMDMKNEICTISTYENERISTQLNDSPLVVPGIFPLAILDEENFKHSKILLESFNENDQKEYNEKVKLAKEQINKFIEFVNRCSTHSNYLIETTADDLFKLEIPQRTHLNLKYCQNLWKFKSHQVRVENIILTPNENDINMKIPGNYKTVFELRSTENLNVCDIPTINPLYPPFLMPIIKFFDKFIRKLPTKFLSEDVKVNRDLFDIVIQANSVCEVMAVITVHCKCPILEHILLNYLCYEPIDTWNLKSLYYKTEDSIASLLYGWKHFYENIRHIKVKLCPNFSYFVNANDIGLLTKIIEDHLFPYHEEMLLEIGCGNGLISLLLASNYEQVIGIDHVSEIQKADEIRRYNNIENVTFEKDETQNINLLFKAIQSYQSITAIINQTRDCGLSMFLVTHLQKLTSLNRLVIVTSFTEKCFPSLLKIMELPTGKFLDGSFIPIRSCIVNTTADKTANFQYVILMER